MRTVKITVKDGEKETFILLDTIEPVSKITATVTDSLRGIGFVSGCGFANPKKPVTTLMRLVEVRTSEMIEDGETESKGMHIVLEAKTDMSESFIVGLDQKNKYIDLLNEGKMDIDFVGINTTNGLINQVQSIARAESITISNIDDVARQLNNSMYHIIKSVMERKESTFSF
jgi:hypothetical protein